MVNVIDSMEFVMNFQNIAREKSPVVCGVDTWPIFRNLIYQNLYEKAYEEDGRRFRYFKISLKNLFNGIKLYFLSSEKLKYIKSDCLFIYELGDIYRDIKGNNYSYLKDPFYEFLTKTFDCHRVIIENDSKSKEHILAATRFKSYYSIYYNIFIIRFLPHYFLLKKNTKHFVRLINLYYEENNIERNLSESWIFDFIYKSYFWYFFYKKLLSKNNTKIIFTCCYFRNPQNYGLCAASDRAGLRLVDIQHGVITPQFRNWQDFRPKCTFLPSHYLCWDMGQFEFQKALNKSARYLRPILGQNINLMNFIGSVSTKNQNLKKAKYFEEKKVILFIHQNIDNQWNTSILLEVVNKIKDKFIVFYRFHPNTSESEKNNIQLFFSGTPKVVFDVQSEESIHSSILLSDICLTRFSTVAIDAAVLQKEVIFIDKTSTVYFSENHKGFNFIFSVKEIVQFLNNYNFHHPAVTQSTDFDGKTLIQSVSKLLSK